VDAGYRNKFLKCIIGERKSHTCAHDNILLSVGIDPNGGTNPWSTGIHWVSAFSSDTYRPISPVQAQVGKTGKVIVFLRATASWPLSHNDVYWDDASLTQGDEEIAATLTVQSSTRPTMHPGHAVILTARAERLSLTPISTAQPTRQRGRRRTTPETGCSACRGCRWSSISARGSAAKILMAWCGGSWRCWEGRRATPDA
jgi:hypothetical protein